MKIIITEDTSCSMIHALRKIRECAADMIDCLEESSPVEEEEHEEEEADEESPKESKSRQSSARRSFHYRRY
jgi:hypothetical protein